MRQNIFHVARKIVELYDGQLTPLKLQKLVYYCQAWSLVWEERPLFYEEFEAWANGPVSPTLYEKHKGTYVINGDFLSEFTEHDFSDEDAQTIRVVVGFYGSKEPFYLSELTHKESPWRDARGNIPMGAKCNNVITKESMREYYTCII